MSLLDRSVEPRGSRPRRRRLRAGAPLAAALAAVLAVGTASPALADDLPPQEPGLTMRVFDLQSSISELCEIKEGQTPNVDELRQTIDWTTAEQFGGLADNFLVHALANLHVPEDGSYAFRLTSDDGSELLVGDQLVVDNDGLHGEESVEGSIDLTAGHHPLRVNFFEATGGQVLRLEWRKPGDAAFSVVPATALSTDADVVRVTSPGEKACEGDEDSPGDGIPLSAVNPAYDLVDLRPDGFQPQVSGLEWLGDDLLVLTWGGSETSTGRLFRLSGVKTATSPADVTYTEIASGLQEPMGIKVVDGDIYVSQKPELSRLVDADGDGVYEGTDTVASWSFDGNFHEFAFGLLYRDGLFHLNLSVSIDYGGATTVPQGSPDRGTHITVAKDTGEVTYVAGGLRTPNGIGWGEGDDIFVTDNQGGWLPANKLVHVQPGRFYHHYTTGPDGQPGRFDDQEPTPPALWLPHNEIANSPSTPVLANEGPFAGQMWISDVTYGGIQRGFLEKVDGEYQGAVFRMTQGLEAGVNRLLLDDDGTIYAGGLGAGGNWGQEGKLQFGLQKLVPNGAVPFDMQRMEVVEGGFEITYTKPLSAETRTDLASRYRMSQWRYVPTSQYGGPKVDEEDLAVTDATVSEDGRTVSLEVDGMKPGRVVYLRSPRPFAAEDGQTLWSTEAWYTLNTYPGYVPPPPPVGMLELEEGDLFGGATVATDHAGYSGAGFVAGLGEVGAGVTGAVSTTTAGEHDLVLRYTNGPNPFQGPKTMTMTVNGEAQQITLPSTSRWDNYSFFVVPVSLTEGENVVRFEHTAADDGHVNLDYVRMVPRDGVRLEAEDAALGGGAVVQDEHAGYSGTGYVGGYMNEGATTTWTVSTTTAGDVPATIGFANGPNPFSGAKTLSLYVNDELARQVSFPDTGAWDSYSSIKETLRLEAGSNTVSLRYDAGDDGNVNLDYLEVDEQPPPTCEPVATPDDQFDGGSLDQCRWSTILNEDPSAYSVSDGALRIQALPGDLSGGANDARNLVLQPAPADGSWTATTTVSLDGSDDYLQGGLVLWGDDNDYAKVMLMRNPAGEWVTELGRVTNGSLAYSNGPALPDGAQQEVTLQMVASDGQLRGRWSLDGGATWEWIGNGYPMSGLDNPLFGVAAYNGTGEEVAAFDHFEVGEPDPEPETCEPATADDGYRMLFDGTRASMEDWTMAGPGSFARTDDCSVLTQGGLGLWWHETPLEEPYSLKLDWKMAGDDNSGVFVGFPDPGTDPWVAVEQGHEIQIDATDDADSTTGAIYNFAAPDAEARDAVLNPPGEWNSYELRVDGDRIQVFLNGALINDYTDTDPNRMNTPSYVGLQNHGNGDDVYFRNVQVAALADLTVEPTVTVSADPSPVEVGSTTRVTVDVTVEGATPAGQVTLSEGDWELGTATLESGSATFDVGPWDRTGTHTLTAEYAGADGIEPGSGQVDVEVVPMDVPAPRLQSPSGRVDAGRFRQVADTVLACRAGTDCDGELELRAGGELLGTGPVGLDSRDRGIATLRLTDEARARLDDSRRVPARLVVTFWTGHTAEIEVVLTR